MSVIAFLSLAIWVILLVGRGGFWRSGPYLPDAPPPAVWPTVKVVIPARDEAATIRQVVEAHGAAPYDGALSLVVGDDSSTDGTADEVRQASAAIPVDVVAIPALPAGWTGKLWALHSAMAAATEGTDPPDYFLLTDADILPAPNLLQQLMALAEERRLDLVSVMARLDNSGLWGGLLIPAFIFFFQKLYPFPLINDPKSSVAGAAGGVVLIRRQALERIGGIAALRGALIDDCTLAQLVKSSAADTAIGLYLSRPTGDAVSLRPNDSYSSMETMVTRSAYAQ
ncbi:MAG: glycosyltransferase, partial [Pseudomonadota bacterium]